MTDIAGRKTRVALLSVASNTILILLKVAVGVVIGSVAVISEAIHSGVDLVAAVIALFAVRAAGQAADERHPYGHGKFENISGTIEALLIIGAAGWIIYEAVHKLIEPQVVEMPGWGVGVMLMSAVVNLLVSSRLFKVSRETDSVALQADAWHLRTDIYTSLGVMAGLLVIWVGGAISPGTNLYWVDPVVAIAVALLILKAAFDLVREAARDLVDVSLPDEEVDWIRDFVVANWPQVHSFHKLRTRKAGSERFVDFHITVDDDMSVADAHALGDQVVAGIKEHFPTSHVNIHIEPCDHSCGDSCAEGCAMDSEGRHGSS